ncbi:zinc-binding dehydrogenase [Halostagnicola larsenii XH-48]|uniref:Zinc-binding dehydrogenase n=1 Tax=Halostagnicola larsenii XH-48 TaxID=797299 RepID=W0JKG4_9EURY|nr:NADPH:quinone reductase [Halostagnicola larsenii]AHF99230.1 zinc-binding dehydrogenase [Halostagnicola larsenii XH-48]
MRAVRYHEHGDADALELEEIPTPEPDEDEVLVEVSAAGINPVDTYFREGSYSPAALPWIPGSDFAGTVEAVGAEVTAFEPGERVFGTGLGKDIPGTCAEYVASPTDRIATLPDGVSFETGAALGVPAVTAWRSLIDHAELEPAERCLIHGGSGGVGHAAVQIAAATGAEVTTTASPEHHEKLESLGADVVLDYARDDLEDAVITAGAPDVILDHRLDDYLQFDADVATQGTRVVGIGNTVPEAGFSNVPAARSKELRIHLISMFNTPDLAAVLRRVATLLSSGKLSAEIDRTYDLTEVSEAHDAVISESFFGKLVVTP